MRSFRSSIEGGFWCCGRLMLWFVWNRQKFQMQIRWKMMCVFVCLDMRYGWWRKSCTSGYGKYPIVCKVLYIPGARFLPSTVRLNLHDCVGFSLSHAVMLSMYFFSSSPTWRLFFTVDQNRKPPRQLYGWFLWVKNHAISHAQRIHQIYIYLP